jgi:hypothetical protein
MLQYLRDRSRYQEKDGGLPNTNNAYRNAFSTPVPIHLQLPALRKETNEPLPTDGGLPKGGGLPDIKLLPQNGGLPGSHSKEFKKKKAHFKKTEYRPSLEKKENEGDGPNDNEKFISDTMFNNYVTLINGKTMTLTEVIKDVQSDGDKSQAKLKRMVIKRLRAKYEGAEEEGKE